MRMHFLALFLALAITPAAAETIQATDAASHVGQTATVEGVVSNVYVSHSGTTARAIASTNTTQRNSA